MWPFHHFLFPQNTPIQVEQVCILLCQGTTTTTTTAGRVAPNVTLGLVTRLKGGRQAIELSRRRPVTQATEATHTTIPIHTYIHTYFMFRFLSSQVERLRESFSPSKTNPKNKKTKTNKGKSTTTHKTKKVKRETKTKTTKRSTQTKLGVKGGVAKNNNKKKKNGVAAKSKPQNTKTGKQDTASASKKTCTNKPKTALDDSFPETAYPNPGPYIRPLARPWEEIAFKVGCHLVAQGFDAERGVAMVRRDLAGDRGAARQHLVLSSYQTFNLSMQTKAKGKRRPDARGFLVQLFGAAGEKGLRVE